MPIKGLTERPASFPQIGILRKGAKKTEANKPGADLKYFRFVCEDTEAQNAFQAAFGAQPEEVEILMPFAKCDENFEAWKEEWAASSLIHRCDGEICVLWLDRTTGTYRTDPKPCPGGCKQTGRVKVIVPSLQRLAYVTVLTTSIWDIINIHENLLAIELLRGDLRGIPLILRRKPREISTPEIKDGKRTGKRMRRAKSLITIEAKPSWVALQLAAQQQSALPSAAPLLLPEGMPEGSPDPEDDEPDMPNTVDTAELVKSIVPPDEPSEEEEHLDKLLKKHCMALKKTTALARQFWQENYEKRTIDQKRHLVKELKLEKPAEEVVHQGDVVQEETSESLIEQIEGEIFKDLGALGIEPKDIISKIASLADGEIGLEDLNTDQLKAVRNGLKLWRDQLRRELKKRAA